MKMSRIDLRKHSDVVDKICTEVKAQLQDMHVIVPLSYQHGFVANVVIQLMRATHRIVNDSILNNISESMIEEVELDASRSDES